MPWDTMRDLQQQVEHMVHRQILLSGLPLDILVQWQSHALDAILFGLCIRRIAVGGLARVNDIPDNVHLIRVVFC